MNTKCLYTENQGQDAEKPAGRGPRSARVPSACCVRAGPQLCAPGALSQGHQRGGAQAAGTGAGARASATAIRGAQAALASPAAGPKLAGQFVTPRRASRQPSKTRSGHRVPHVRRTPEAAVLVRQPGPGGGAGVRGQGGMGVPGRRGRGGGRGRHLAPRDWPRARPPPRLSANRPPATPGRLVPPRPASPGSGLPAARRHVRRFPAPGPGEHRRAQPRPSPGVPRRAPARRGGPIRTRPRRSWAGARTLPPGVQTVLTPGLSAHAAAGPHPNSRGGGADAGPRARGAELGPGEGVLGRGAVMVPIADFSRHFGW